MSNTEPLYKSLAYWPDGVCGNSYGNNVSQDTHSDLCSAIGVISGLCKDGFGGQGKHFPLRAYTAVCYPNMDQYNELVGQHTFGIGLYYEPRLNAISTNGSINTSHLLLEAVFRDTEACDVIWPKTRESILELLTQFPLQIGVTSDRNLCSYKMLACLQFSDYGEASKVVYLLDALEQKPPLLKDAYGWIAGLPNTGHLSHYVPDLFRLECALLYLNQCFTDVTESYNESMSEDVLHIPLSALIGFKDVINILYYETYLHAKLYTEGLNGSRISGVTLTTIQGHFALTIDHAAKLPTDLDFKRGIIEKIGAYNISLKPYVHSSDYSVNKEPELLTCDLKTCNKRVTITADRDILLLEKNYNEVACLLNKLTFCVLYQKKKGSPVSLKLPFPIDG